MRTEPRSQTIVRRASWWIWGILPLLAASSWAQTYEGERFEGSTEVLEVQVPVNVYDRNGQAIRGLTQDDFTVLEGGAPQQISGFEVVDLDLLGPETAIPGRAELEIPAAARRHVLLLFDLAFSDLSAVLRARQAAQDFVLHDLHPADLVAVATHSVETGPRLVVTFTPDRAQVARAIETLGAPRLLGLRRRDPLSFLIDDPVSKTINLDSSEGSINTATRALEQNVEAHLRVISKQMNRMERSYSRGRIFSWAHSMGEMARILDSVEGRKQVVYFSEGFDGRLLLGRQPDAQDEEYQSDLLNIALGNVGLVDTDDLYGNTALQNDVYNMLEEFRRANCVIQAVNIGGLRADPQAEERRLRKAGTDALFYVANETGGELFEEANELTDGLVSVLESTAVTYLLSFRPEDVEADGSYHRIKVEAKAPRGSRVSYRQGYYAPRPYEELHPLEKNLLASGAIAAAEERRDIGMDVLVAPFNAGEGKAYVPVIVEVSGRDLLTGQEDDLMSVEIYCYATGSNGEMRDFFTQLVTLNLSSNTDAFERAGLKYYGHVELPPGDYSIRVLVRNSETGRSGVEVAGLTIPSFETGDPVLLPPFFPEPPNIWHLAREQGNEYQSTVVYPFTVNGNPYIPAANPHLRPDEETEFCLIAYNLGVGALNLDGRIVGQDGEVVEDGVDVGVVERTITGIAGLDKLVARFQPGKLTDGRYRLEVSLVEASSGRQETASVPFTVLN